MNLLFLMQTAFYGSRRCPFGRITATNYPETPLGESAECDAGRRNKPKAGLRQIFDRCPSSALPDPILMRSNSRRAPELTYEMFDIPITAAFGNAFDAVGRRQKKFFRQLNARRDHIRKKRRRKKLFILHMKIAAAYAQPFCRLPSVPQMRGRTENLLSQREKRIKQRTFDFHFRSDHLDQCRAKRPVNALARSPRRKKIIHNQAEQSVKSLSRKQRNRFPERKFFKKQRCRAFKMHPTIDICTLCGAVRMALTRAKQKSRMRRRRPPFAVHLEKRRSLHQQQQVIRIPIFPQHAKILSVRSFPNSQNIHNVCPKNKNRSIL